MTDILMALGVIVFAVAGFVTLFVPLVLLRGWVLSVLWGWFMVPLFGLPALGIAQAIGVGLVITTFTGTHMDNCKKDEKYKSWHPLVQMFTLPLLSLAIGWVVRRWM